MKMQKKKNEIACKKYLVIKFLCFLELGLFHVHTVAHLYINIPTEDFKAISITKLKTYSHSSLNGINSVAEGAFPVLVTWDIQ